MCDKLKTYPSDVETVGNGFIVIHQFPQEASLSTSKVINPLMSLLFLRKFGIILKSPHKGGKPILRRQTHEKNRALCYLDMFKVYSF